jgi:hypothetical protein
LPSRLLIRAGGDCVFGIYPDQQSCD